MSNNRWLKIDINIPEQQDYPSLLKYLVHGGIDNITELEMDHIFSLFQLRLQKLISIIDIKTNFTDILLSENINLKDYVDIKFINWEEECKIIACRMILFRLTLDEITDYYKNLKISYKRSGRIEVGNNALRRMNFEIPEQEGVGLKNENMA